MRKKTFGGIYSILNRKTGKRYVGSSIDIGKRWYDHRLELRNGTHGNAILQRSWLKHGENAFEFEVLEQIDYADALRAREQHWIDELKATDKSHGYNICLFVGYSRRGLRNSPATRAKISASKKGQGKGVKRGPYSAEWRAHISAGQRGRVTSPETRERLSMAGRGRVVSEETRRKLSIVNTGRAPEIIEKTAAAHRGMKRSAETRLKLSIAARNRGPVSEATRAKLSATSKGRIRTPEAIAKMVATKKAIRVLRAA